MAYKYIVKLVDSEGRASKVDCGQSFNIANGISKIQLGRGAQSAVIEVIYDPNLAPIKYDED